MIARSRWIILPSVFLLVSLLGVLDAKQPPAQCGTHPTRRQEELFLHGRHTAMRARNGLAAAAEQRFAVTNRDIGNIAVIEDSGGVIGRRNLFDLDRTTLTFSTGEWRVQRTQSAATLSIRLRPPRARSSRTWPTTPRAKRRCHFLSRSSARCIPSCGSTLTAISASPTAIRIHRPPSGISPPDFRASRACTPISTLRNPPMACGCWRKRRA
jgi:hypothetical protein